MHSRTSTPLSMPGARRGRRSIGALLVLMLLASLVVLPAAPAAAIVPVDPSDWYVDKATGSDTTGDGSQGDPFESITAALATANADDTIYVAEGTYTFSLLAPLSAAITPGDENFPLSPDHGQQIIATGDVDKTIIDGQGQTRIFDLSHKQGILIKGFTLLNGTGGDGGALYMYMSQATLEDCKVIDCSGWLGGGVYSWGSDLTVDGCYFAGNGWSPLIFNAEDAPDEVAANNVGGPTARYGGAIYADEATTTITDSTFFNNGADYAGGAIYAEEGSYLSMTSSLVESNTVETAPVFPWDPFGGESVFKTGDLASYVEDSVPVGKIMWTGGTGGGVAIAYGAAADYSKSNFVDNKAYWTGGVFADSTSIYHMADCEVLDNWGSYAGGGVAQHPFIDPSMEVDIIGEPAPALEPSDGFQVFADGIPMPPWPSAPGTSTVKRTWFEDNVSVFGSGLTADHHDAAVENCVFVGNDTSNGPPDAVMIVLAADATVHSSTFVANTGLHANIRAVDTRMSPYPATCDVKNTIFWDSELIEFDLPQSRTTADGSIPFDMPPPADTESCTVSYSDTPNGDVNFPPGPGNIGDDPLFVNEAGLDFHLTSTSPAKDTGTTMHAPFDDFDNAYRPVGAGFDMGAFEFQSDIDPGSDRLDGDNRYKTAIEVSREHFDSASTVILARGDVFADGLAASGLAGSYEAPILLTPPDMLLPEVVAELARLECETVILMGGPTAISGDVATQLFGLGYDVQRIGGADRYETAALIAQRIAALTGDDPVPVTFIARGDLFADALAVSPVAYALQAPVLLVEPNSLPGATVDVMLDSPPLSTVVLGGKEAVSQHVTKELAPAAAGIDRVSGADRYATAAAIAAHAVAEGWSSWSLTGLATGIDFADALTGGPAIGSDGGVLLLTDPNTLSGATAGALTTNKGDIVRVEVLGGYSAIAASVEAAALAIAP